MPLSEETNSLSRALDDMKDKTGALQESLRGLAENGLHPLFKALTQSLSAAQSTAPRKPERDIIAGTLDGVARHELPHVIGAILGLPLPQNGRTAGGADGGITVVINNNTQTSVTARELSTSDDRKYLEITIDQMVANSLLRGRQTSGVLRSLFGLAPDLTGR